MMMAIDFIRGSLDVGSPNNPTLLAAIPLCPHFLAASAFSPPGRISARFISAPLIIRLGALFPPSVRLDAAAFLLGSRARIRCSAYTIIVNVVTLVYTLTCGSGLSRRRDIMQCPPRALATHSEQINIKRKLNTPVAAKSGREREKSAAGKGGQRDREQRRKLASEQPSRTGGTSAPISLFRRGTEQCESGEH